MKILVIQYPPVKTTGQTIHPIRIDMATGDVLDQDVWAGSPMKFIGFVRYEDGRAFYVEAKDADAKTFKDIQERFFPMFYSKYNGIFTNEGVSIKTDVHKRNDYTLSIVDKIKVNINPKEARGQPRREQFGMN